MRRNEVPQQIIEHGNEENEASQNHGVDEGVTASENESEESDGFGMLLNLRGHRNDNNKENQLEDSRGDFSAISNQKQGDFSSQGSAVSPHSPASPDASTQLLKSAERTRPAAKERRASISQKIGTLFKKEKQNSVQETTLVDDTRRIEEQLNTKASSLAKRGSIFERPLVQKPTSVVNSQSQEPEPDGIKQRSPPSLLDPALNAECSRDLTFEEARAQAADRRQGRAPAQFLPSERRNRDNDRTPSSQSTVFAQREELPPRFMPGHPPPSSLFPINSPPNPPSSMMPSNPSQYISSQPAPDPPPTAPPAVPPYVVAPPLASKSTSASPGMRPANSQIRGPIRIMACFRHHLLQGEAEAPTADNHTSNQILRFLQFGSCMQVMCYVCCSRLAMCENGDQNITRVEIYRLQPVCRITRARAHRA
eukprot:CAMPEP_0175132524 /NCGR_PEP_ID=MMETSP0087-20121206/7121_1 /TAXON_ID=136419 /ORGANISM="Unknown Unknown, Strain D1" /LENGTH=422 /DNA_ID=CAMNT_0016414885 /DNA_START=221 /DNA_END=1489 /DNA_ORIENTATION=-